ncbi:MAG: hypothetical protein FWD97_03580 [Defluviitaleaceae bacterium]|nr:hypothetical protein [Defluviitaleaceae bacterium]
MMKKVLLTAISLFVLVFALAACGNNNDDNDTAPVVPVTPSETLPEDNDPIVPDEDEDEDQDEDTQDQDNVANEDDIRGNWDGNVYTNHHLGITFTAPADWEISTDAELATLFGLTSNFNGLNALQTVGIFSDMMAICPETGNNVQVIFESLDGLTMTETDYINEMIPEFEAIGASVTVIPGTISLGNRNWYSYDTLLFGIDGRQLLSIQGDVAVMLVITTITYSDGVVEEILNMFDSL